MKTAFIKKIVAALPAVCLAGTAVMPTLGYLLRQSLSFIDLIAFGLDTVGYAAAVVPLHRRHIFGWIILVVLTAIQPIFSVVKLVIGEGNWWELTGRILATALILAALSLIRTHYSRHGHSSIVRE